MRKKFIKGLIDGSIGIDIVEIFDANKDGKVSFKEIRNASVDQWVKFLVSMGTSIITVLHFT